MRTCRFCKAYDVKRGDLVKYAARHWAHFSCWLDTKGKELADPREAGQVVALLSGAFWGWQLRQFPVFRLADWLERHATNAPGKTWVDKAMNVLKEAIGSDVEVAR